MEQKLFLPFNKIGIQQVFSPQCVYTKHQPYKVYHNVLIQV